MTTFSSEQLRTLLAALEHGTFEAAARALHLTPSAVSQRIKALEQDAGAILVQRSTPLRPTPAGLVVHRLARQLRQLEADAATELGLGMAGSTTPIVVNADSLGTWFLAALAAIPPQAGLAFEILSRDEQESVGLLRTGEVMAAVTATAQAVAGCRVVPLGAMSYRAIAARDFARQHFPHGVDAAALRMAPVVQFDRADTLQNTFAQELAGVAPAGVQHFIPDTVQFARAVALGLGWGMLPAAQCEDGLRAGTLVDLVPGRTAAVPLFWQRWKIASPTLDIVTTAVIAAAAAALD